MQDFNTMYRFKNQIKNKHEKEHKGSQDFSAIYSKSLPTLVCDSITQEVSPIFKPTEYQLAQNLQYQLSEKSPSKLPLKVSGDVLNLLHISIYSVDHHKYGICLEFFHSET